MTAISSTLILVPSQGRIYVMSRRTSEGIASLRERVNRVYLNWAVRTLGERLAQGRGQLIHTHLVRRQEWQRQEFTTNPLRDEEHLCLECLENCECTPPCHSPFSFASLDRDHDPRNCQRNRGDPLMKGAWNAWREPLDTMLDLRAACRSLRRKIDAEFHSIVNTRLNRRHSVAWKICRFQRRYPRVRLPPPPIVVRNLMEEHEYASADVAAALHWECYHLPRYTCRGCFWPAPVVAGGRRHIMSFEPGVTDPGWEGHGSKCTLPWPVFPISIIVIDGSDSLITSSCSRSYCSSASLCGRG